MSLGHSTSAVLFERRLIPPQSVLPTYTVAAAGETFVVDLSAFLLFRFTQSLQRTSHVYCRSCRGGGTFVVDLSAFLLFKMKIDFSFEAFIMLTLVRFAGMVTDIIKI